MNRHAFRDLVHPSDIHTKGIESFWSMCKRTYVGTYHYMSDKQCIGTSTNILAGSASVRTTLPANLVAP